MVLEIAFGKHVLKEKLPVPQAIWVSQASEFTGNHQSACHAPIALDLSFWPFCSHVVWRVPSGVCASADSTSVLPSLYSYSHLLSASTLTYGALVRDGVKTYRARRTDLFCESGVCCGLRIFIHGHSLADLTLA